MLVFTWDPILFETWWNGRYQIWETNTVMYQQYQETKIHIQPYHKCYVCPWCCGPCSKRDKI